jgi:hypothetical protein
MAQNATNRMNETRLTITNVIRENPIPAAMLGVSLGWLFWSVRQQRTLGASSPYAGQELERDRSDVTAGEYVRDTELSDTLAEPGADFDATKSVSERTGKIVDNVKSTGSKLGERAKNVAAKVAEKTRAGTRNVQDQFFESPLALGTATLAVGLATGLAVPASRKEVELVGDVRDRLVDRVRNVARETTENAQYVAGR